MHTRAFLSSREELMLKWNQVLRSQSRCCLIKEHLWFHELGEILRETDFIIASLVYATVINGETDLGDCRVVSKPIVSL